MLVRTWNVFHGNTSPPQRHALLRDALQLAVSGDPDLVCLQELPAWSLVSETAKRMSPLVFTVCMATIQRFWIGS